VLLPTSTGPATQWVVYDYGRKFLQSAAPSTGGQSIVTVGTVPSDELWLIDIVRVKTAASDLTSQAFVCMDDPSRDVAGTFTGSYDVADQASAIQAPANTTVLLVWNGIPDGLTPSAYVQWTVLKSTSTMGG
jgi:hypothetical protein